MSFIIIYTTHPDLKTARKIASVLLKKRLIACANFFPIQSSYWWQGKIENTKEIVAILKTTKKNWNKVKTAVSKLHPYKTPCLIKFDVTSNSDYADWINTNVV